MSNERFDITLSPAPREATRLLYISKSRFGGDWHSIPHTHACTELFYCISGRGKFNITGGLHDVRADDLIIVNPQVEHTELSYNANPLEYIVLGIEGIEFLFKDGTEGYTLINCRETQEAILPLLQELLYEVDHRREGCETICQDLLDILLIRLVRGSSFVLRQTANHTGSKECAAVKRYLDENYTESLSLDDLAQIAHINKYYLVHTFNREYGVSPITYLIRRRIRESKYLLGNTDYSLSQISSVMGFSSLSYFSQSFRKQEGVSPNEYRKQVRAGVIAPLPKSDES